MLEPVDPMRAFLAGWLLSSLSNEGREAMKIVDVVPGHVAPYGFEVTFASGIRVAVKIDELPAK